ncbi:MAG: methylmalonyl-CoA mutase family protein, partial [Desulfobacteraceae bacterium]|nr:methylmalonyl-CoA mutase family protein [Desulfobacteraceae bacterium]
MNGHSASHAPRNPIRVITATALFDGHDAAINIIRRILQDSGAEVIHLGHNRSVAEIAKAAIEEDVRGIAISSYQGGHMEFFKYLLDMLREKGAGHIKIFGGGGGVIVPDEIRELEDYGIAKIYSPADGSKMGLQGMIDDILRHLDFPAAALNPDETRRLRPQNPALVARLISAAETAKSETNESGSAKRALPVRSDPKRIPVIGFTGTGGAGKSSLTDELVIRLLRDLPDIHIGILSCDPSRRKTGGALLGDRIRMNGIDTPQVYMRSLAVRQSGDELPEVLPDAIHILKAAGFDLIIAETAGIGQGASKIFDVTDLSVYVMTSDYGAASQLEKIDMLDYADIVVINKFDKEGSDDALRDVRKQVQRNRKAWETPLEKLPVFGTIASRFNDDGVTALYQFLILAIHEKTGVRFNAHDTDASNRTSTSKTIFVPPERIRYLSEIADTVRIYHRHTRQQAGALRNLWHLQETAALMASQDPEAEENIIPNPLRDKIRAAEALVHADTQRLMAEWEDIRAAYGQDTLTYQVRNREIRIPLHTESLAHTRIPKIALPGFQDPGEIYRWMRRENVPGHFPYTAGVFPLKRTDEDPTRMFAGEGDPARTNRRFRLLSGNYEANRLSTAFDSVTLYGFDPDIQPDIYGKVGTSGVSVCSIEDVAILYSGFDLAAPNTSVSMTINGPAPMMLAMFLNTAMSQQLEKFTRTHGREPDDGETLEIQNTVLSQVRGTIQADILKEDQGQNTCIFSVDFALKMMGDIQEYFIQNNVRNFYSVSVSGYHIAEAGANPISQAAFTLANGFTYVEYYLSRGMDIDSFAPNLSFFFSSGLDPEYSVIGRVARRIWAIAMREKYGASERSQMLKYHIQTSGRSLHSQEIQFNDIRTTLQALYAVQDNCNSLHTNAYDEAVTTPSEESVRRSLAIQLIINRELGLIRNENAIQGSFFIEALTDMVETAILAEFDRISARGGVRGAMERGYQRSKIQDESIYYEQLKHSGQLPIIGVNTFQNPKADDAEILSKLELARATDAEKASQLKRREEFIRKHRNKAPEALKQLQNTALSGGNIFAEMMHTVKYCTLGQITQEWLATRDDPRVRTSGGYWHHQQRAEPHPSASARRF